MSTLGVASMVASALNTDPEKVSAWGKLIRDIGVPIIMLCAMSFAMYEGGMWIGENILLPTLQKNEALVDSQTKSNEALLSSLNVITENIRQQTDANKSNTAALAKMVDDISAIRVATEQTADDKNTLVEINTKTQKLLESYLDSKHP